MKLLKIVLNFCLLSYCNMEIKTAKKWHVTLRLCVRHDRKDSSARAKRKPKVVQKMKLKPMAQFITSGWNQRRKKE